MSVGARGDHRPSVVWHEMRQIVKSRLQNPRVRRALDANYKIDQSYDIAYVAGISNDLSTLFVDRHFPLTEFPVPKPIDVTPEIWFHECGEHCFIEIYGDHYLRAHRLITVGEHDMVVLRGINWPRYKDGFDVYDKRTEHEQIQRSPKELYLKPYTDSGDWQLLQRIHETMV